MSNELERKIDNGRYFHYYLCYFQDYSPKAYLISFGFINAKGVKRESIPLFFPKVVCKIDFDKKIISILKTFVGKHSLGYLHHYKTSRKRIKPVKLLKFLSDSLEDNE